MAVVARLYHPADDPGYMGIRPAPKRSQVVAALALRKYDRSSQGPLLVSATAPAVVRAVAGKTGSPGGRFGVLTPADQRCLGETREQRQPVSPLLPVCHCPPSPRNTGVRIPAGV